MATVEPRRNMPEHFGIRIVSAEKQKVVAELDADERHLNDHGIVHGGAYMAFADDVGGTIAGLNKPADMSTTTVESKSNFFRATPPGKLTAISVPVHVGRRTIVVETSIYGPDGKLAARVTQTQLVIPRAPRE
ncbi:MAG TPA: PaaI family thioesterase [Stellaceae bacterium]|nr:PaaI family thioesterase [Stellaceae bacterium]